MLTVLDLFSGIGGFSHGLERTGGFKTVAFCEIDPFCRRVLAKHWPDVPCHHDITKLRGDDVGPVDVVCGGFPCQDISVAGKGAGLAGERSGLFYEIARLVGELRPGIIILENVSALLARGLSEVLGELATLGYDAEWHCIPASAVGAPHRRDRVWIVAYAQFAERGENPSSCRRMARQKRLSQGQESPGGLGASGQIFPNSEGHRRTAKGQWPAPGHIDWRDQLRRQQKTHWEFESDVGRVANGVPNRLDRLRALGNAVVPQIPELIGRAILEAMLDV